MVEGSLGFGIVTVVKDGAIVVGGGISRGVLATATELREAIEGAFMVDELEEAFTDVLPTELPDVFE